MLRRCLFPLFIIFLFTKNSFSQSGNLFIRNFPPSEYRNIPLFSPSPQNFDITQDSRGVIYVANTTAILKYDGSNWNGLENLPDNSIEHVRHLSKDSSGIIYFGGTNELGFIAPERNGSVSFHSLIDSLPEKYRTVTILNTICAFESVYFFATNEVLKWNKKSFQIFDLQDSLIKSFFIDNKIFVILSRAGLCSFNDGKFEPLPYGDVVAHLGAMSIFTVDTTSEFNWWILTARKGIYSYNGKSLTKIISDADPIFNSSAVLCAIRIDENNFAIGTNDHGIIVLNALGNIKDQIDKNSGLNDDHVNNLYHDDGGGLWAALDYGLSRIEYPAPLRFFDHSNGVNGIIYCILEKDNEVLAGTSQGLFSLNEKSNSSIFKKIKNSTITWSIRNVDGETLVASDSGLFTYTDGKLKRLLPGTCKEIYCSTVFPGELFIGGMHGVKVMMKKKGTWALEGSIAGINNEVRNIVDDTKGNIWASYGQVWYVDFHGNISLNPTVTSLTQKEGFIDSFQTTEVYRIYDKIYFGSYIGLFSFDEQNKRLIKDTSFGKSFGNTSGQAFELTEDKAGGIWMAAEFHDGRIIKKGGTYIWDTIPFMPIPSKSTWSIYFDDHQVAWFGTEEGLYRFNSSDSKNYAHPFRTIFNSITASNKDTIFRGSYPDSSGSINLNQPKEFLPHLKHAGNDLTFTYAALTYDSKDETQYSYKLEGKNDHWSDWSREARKEFSNLHEGKYAFHVKAKNVYGIESTEAAFSFAILPPLYRTWWAYLTYIVVFTLLILIIIQLNQKRLISEKKSLERKVKERTQEISRQKELVEKEKENVEKKTHELENTLDALKQTQSQLIQSEKMASIGILTAGIAHEINNPINFVTSSVNPLKRNFSEVRKLIDAYEELLNQTDQKLSAAGLKEKLNLSENLSESESLLDGIEEGSRRTSDIVKGLRNFSRLDSEEMKKVNINDGIESTMSLLNNKLMRQNIEVVKSYGIIPIIDGYPGQLNQVFMNLFTNAIDAIGEKGKIFITTTKENNFVKISFNDTGSGMTDEVKEKIFDPFFTTKEIGKGTGLGLSISYGIIEKHNGKIEVKTQPGKGSEFIITLPVVSANRLPAKKTT